MNSSRYSSTVYTIKIPRRFYLRAIILTSINSKLANCKINPPTGNDCNIISTQNLFFTSIFHHCSKCNGTIYRLKTFTVLCIIPIARILWRKVFGLMYKTRLSCFLFFSTTLFPLFTIRCLFKFFFRFLFFSLQSNEERKTLPKITFNSL